MAFLDFLRNRQASPQQAVANKLQPKAPESAKEMYSRQVAEEAANRKQLNEMPAEQRAKVDAIKATLAKATQHLDKSAYPPAAGPADGMGNREAMRQNMTGQEKAAPGLSPTDAQTGRTAEKITPAPEKSTERAKTMPRPRPSWER